MYKYSAGSKYRVYRILTRLKVSLLVWPPLFPNTTLLDKLSFSSLPQQFPRLRQGRSKVIFWMLVSFCFVHCQEVFRLCWGVNVVKMIPQYSLMLTSRLRGWVHDWWCSMQFFFHTSRYAFLHWQCVWDHCHALKRSHCQPDAFQMVLHGELKTNGTFLLSWFHKLWRDSLHHWLNCSPKP